MPADRDAEVTHELSSFVAELRRLADALESGTAFMIEVDGEEIEVPQNFGMSIAHEREGGQIELEFQLTWSEIGAADEDDDEEADDDAETKLDDE